MITKYFTASVVYFFAFIATACMSVTTLMFIEKNIGLHTFFLTGDIDIVVALLLFGNLFFYLVNLFILKQEVSSSSLCRMHVKQSFLLYILFFVSMPMVAGMLHGFISIENYSVTESRNDATSFSSTDISRRNNAH